jgi:hypothetical protein
MNEIVDLTQYRNTQRAPQVATDEIPSDLHGMEAVDDTSASPEPKPALRASLRLCRSLATFGKRAASSFNGNRSIDELSPHLQRDIGMTDFCPPARLGPWDDGAMTSGGYDRSWQYRASRW